MSESVPQPEIFVEPTRWRSSYVLYRPWLCLFLCTDAAKEPGTGVREFEAASPSDAGQDGSPAQLPSEAVLSPDQGRPRSRASPLQRRPQDRSQAGEAWSRRSAERGELDWNACSPEVHLWFLKSRQSYWQIAADKPTSANVFSQIKECFWWMLLTVTITRFFCYLSLMLPLGEAEVPQNAHAFHNWRCEYSVNWSKEKGRNCQSDNVSRHLSSFKGNL